MKSGLDPGLGDGLGPRADLRPDCRSRSTRPELLGLLEAPKEPVRATVETVQRVSRRTSPTATTPTPSSSRPASRRRSTFSEGHGCLGRVVFDGLGIEADLEHGGAIVSIPALEPGTYGFRCGMDMVHGTLIAE